MRRVWSAVVIGITVACASCSDTTADRSATTTADSPPSASDGQACDQTPIRASGFPEVQGIGRDATIYGLLFPTHPGPIRSGDELKIVWRMTGQGDLSVSYFAPDGRPGVLTFGPEPHGGSSYQRPGDEWGTGFLFDAAGCWRIHLERPVGSGDVWIAIAP